MDKSNLVNTLAILLDLDAKDKTQLAKVNNSTLQKMVDTLIAQAHLVGEAKRLTKA